MSASWPDGLPTTLWIYTGLQVQDAAQIPKMGVQFQNKFLLAFFAGLLFIAYFGWYRFKAKPHGATEFRYRVMRELEVENLGGAAALRQAYLIYLATLLALYVAMTFFGRLIVQTINELRVVGIQVDTSSLQFDSPLWPLMLAFGFAGAAPLVPQLQAAEGWLFQRAYRAVGIPVRIHETTRNVISLLNSATAANAETAGDLSKETEERKKEFRNSDPTKTQWLSDSIGLSEFNYGLNVLAQLDLLVIWARGARGRWPGSEVSDEVRDMEQAIAIEADKLLRTFKRRLHEKKPAEQIRTARAEDFAVSTIEKGRELRDELCAILAVYMERDPRCVGPSAVSGDLVKSSSMRDLMKMADPPNLAGSGPELGVVVSILFMIPVYAVAIWRGVYPPLWPGASHDNIWAVLTTAGLSALQLIAVFCFPLLAAFALRQYYHDQGNWVARLHVDSSVYIQQRLAALMLGLMLSIICLSGVAALWAFLISRDVTIFQANLVSGYTPFLLYFPSLAFLAVPVVWFTLEATEARKGDRSAISYGLLSATFVLVLQAAHLRFWYNGMPCTEKGTFLADILEASCFQYYGGIDFLVYPALAFMTAVMFGNPRPLRSVLRRAPVVSVSPGPSRTALYAVAFLVFFAYHTSLAQEQTETVTIGFRTDVEPFSYAPQNSPFNSGSRSRADDNPPVFRGYLADLCYWIFDGSNYAVAEQTVSASDRFDKLRDGKIDVLCDPVTLRYWNQDPFTMEPVESPRAKAGIFSPIVFATGVTYLHRPFRRPGSPVYVGYVRETTARDVLRHLCKLDVFAKVQATERAERPVMCRTASAAGFLDQLRWEKDEQRVAELFARGVAMAEEAARAEAEFFEAQPSDPGHDKSGGWKATADSIRDCRKEDNCSSPELLAELGNRCEKLYSDAKGAVEPERQATYQFCSFQSHDDLVDTFCHARNKDKDMVYLGDREIILGKLQTWNDRNHGPCSVSSQSGASDLTYEPYAIMMARPSDGRDLAEVRKRQKIAELVQRRIYEFFSFSALAQAKFDTYFLGPSRDRQMSIPLAYLFLLNAVEQERLFTLPTSDPSAEAGKAPPGRPWVETDGP